tara:strand:- start:150 stop:860 length:711 start_codon:yes stop_codon:yes gene_type:complete
MKQILKTIIRNVKSINGNSLAEFATTTALMATLAATAAPKLSEMAEGSKESKSMNEMDKILTQAQAFYNDTAEAEGRGRFPGQDKYDIKVGGHTDDADVNNDLITLATNGDATAGSFTTWKSGDGTKWRSVFGVSNADAMQASLGQVSNDPVATASCGTCPGVGINSSVHADGNAKSGADEWSALFGGNTLASPYQDGHFIYVVVAGGGSGTTTYPPILYVADAENPSDFNVSFAP